MAGFWDLVGTGIAPVKEFSQLYFYSDPSSILNSRVAVILDYKRPWMLCLALKPGQKLGLILVESGFKIEITKKSI